MTSKDGFPSAHDAHRHSETLPLARAGLDRAGAERAEDDLMERLRADPATRVLVLHGDRAPLDADGALLYVSPFDVVGDVEWAFLGRHDERDDARSGLAVLAAVSRADGDAPIDATEWGALRAVGGDLSATDAGAFVEALALGRWLLDAPFCPACGSQTVVRAAGWARRCPSCGREHFPRTDPAVIVAVTSASDPDQLLLGSNAMWAEQNRYSTFAGFVEAGESLEAAVEREVHEESGIVVAGMSYRGSQSWPYPRSLMLGFRAVAADDDAAVADGEEIVAVRWFTRDEIGAALAGEGDVLLPGSASIARRLIADWHAGTP